MADKVDVENVNTPGRTARVDAAKYAAMREIYLNALPGDQPGLTHAEVKEKVLPALPDELFPGGATCGWWMKTVQLDLEAKGLVAREETRPLRFHRTG